MPYKLKRRYTVDTKPVMKVESEIKKWGNSLALRVTGVMAELPKFAAGTKVLVEVTEEGLVVTPAARQEPAFRLPYRESDLLADITPRTAHADELAEPIGDEAGE
jgi:antitoxin MazE